MRRYTYTLTARTAVSAGQSDQRANVRRAHEVVPGATVRGALAAQWWHARNESDSGAGKVFNELFERDLLVGQAVPSDMELMSASARVCKYRPFAECGEVLQERGFPGNKPVWSTCWVCGGPFTSDAGWRRPAGREETTVTGRTRGALTDRETAEEGSLFTRHAVVGRTGEAVFTGVIRAPEETTAWLDGLNIRLGGGRSLDYGDCILTVREAAWPALPDGGSFLLRLVSPAVLVDEFGGSTASIEALTAELRRVSGIADLAVSAPAAWLRTESVSGWHMRSRLPKRHDWALAPGSVAIVTGLTRDGWGRLQAGIGMRTLEGYGQVEIVDPGQLPAEPANQGVERLVVLRRKIPQQKTWSGVKRDLLVTLQKSAAAAPSELAAYRAAATFPALFGDAAAAAKAVLNIPPGHIPGTIAKLQEMK